jgi:hypothetical protein
MNNSKSRFGLLLLLLYLCAGMAQTVMAQKEIGVFYSNWFDYPTNWTNTGGCIWAEPELGWYKSADPAVIDQHTEWLVNNGADFVMFDWSNNCDNSGSNIQLIESNSIAFAERQVWRKQNGLSTIKYSVFMGTCGNCDNATNGNSYAIAERVKQGFLDDPNKASLYWNFKGKPFLGSFVLLCETKGIQFSHPSFTYRPITTGNGSTDRGIFWSWEESAPDNAGYSTYNGEKEAITILAAYRGTGSAPGVVPQYPNGLPGWLNDGTVFGNKTYPRNNGQTFRDAFDYAISQNTPVIMIQSFNEWTGCVATPGEEMDLERSNDLEPMKGGHGDLYLRILKEKAEKYKGITIGSNNKNYWNFDVDMEGWSGFNSMITSVTNGNAIMTVTGVDPNLYSPDNLNINALDYRYVVVSMHNETSDNRAHIYFSTNSSTNMEEAKSVNTAILPNDASQRYYFFDMSANPAWNGTIKQIRFDPANNATSGSVKIDFIKLVGTHHSSPLAIPGTLQVEDFNKGGQGNAYNDNDVANNGGEYRTTEGVDIETTGDATGSYNIGWTVPGEWTEYLVDVSETGTYIVTARTAAAADGAEIRLRLNGENLGNVIQLANTGGYQVYANNVFTVQLTRGKHILRLVSVTGGYNSNYISFQKQAIAITPHTRVNGGAWTETNTATLCAGGAVSFGPHPVVVNGWTWTGPNGFSANTRVITFNSAQSTHSGSYTATYTDAHSNTATQEFNLTVQEQPSATITTQDALNGENNGAITLSFNDNPTRTNIAFSINDGVNYTSVADNAGSYTFGELAQGDYSVWTRWGNAECPINLGSYNIGNQDSEDPVGISLTPNKASNNENHEDSQAYDLQGRKIQGTPKGLWLDSELKLRINL